MLAFAAIMSGQSQRALKEVRAMSSVIPDAWISADPMNTIIADSFRAVPIEVLVRFGRWDDVLAEPEPAETFPVSRTIRHAARGMAFASRKEIANARAEQQLFRDSAAKVVKEAIMGNNPASAVFAVADPLLEGEILLQEGKTDEGLAKLREAIKAEDALRYDEPPDWIMPVRHALGAWLIRSAKADKAEEVYREDLRRWPDNGWSLYGLAESLRIQGKKDEESQVRRRFQEIWKNADIELTSSCFCQTEKPGT
jgi:tetratricopeptide (TPR) repeat protein